MTRREARQRIYAAFDTVGHPVRPAERDVLEDVLRENGIPPLRWAYCWTLLFSRAEQRPGRRDRLHAALKNQNATFRGAYHARVKHLVDLVLCVYG